MKNGNRRSDWEIGCFIEDLRDRRFIRAGLILSLALHLGYLGHFTYQAYQQAKSWKNLLTLRVIDVPTGARPRSEIEILELRNPLYYPPGLVRPAIAEAVPGKTKSPRLKKEDEPAPDRDETPGA